jgi:hypothetical protein
VQKVGLADRVVVPLVKRQQPRIDNPGLLFLSTITVLREPICSVSIFSVKASLPIDLPLLTD